MNIKDLMKSLLTPEEQQELHSSLKLLEDQNYSEFYEKSKDLIANILFIENYAEFNEFTQEDDLDTEYFCFAFLCGKNHGIQVGGYEDDLTERFTAFFDSQKPGYAEISAIIRAEKIYTDYDGKDNFAKSLKKINQVLSAHHLQLVVFENDVYCACEYTILLLGQSFADTVAASWESDNFRIYL